MQRMVLLSGPSCVGKGPLLRAIKKLYRNSFEKLHRAVIYNDRSPRVGEEDGVDFNFVSTDEIKKLPRSDFITVEIRPGNWQALPLKALDAKDDQRIAFAEVHFTIAEEIIRRSEEIGDLQITMVFLSPLSKHELQYLLEQPYFKKKELKKLVSELMRRKLLRRTKRQKVDISLEDLNDIEKRASRAFDEMTHAWQYDYVIPNHDGEDSDNWEQFYFPIGDALKACEVFRRIIDNDSDITGTEKWGESLLR